MKQECLKDDENTKFWGTWEQTPQYKSIDKRDAKEL